MHTPTPTRRELVTRYGAGAALLLVTALRSRRGHAASGAPRRLILLSKPNGVSHRDFWPTTVGSGYSVAGKTLADFQPIAGKVNVIHGLNVVRTNIGGCTHDTGYRILFTGQNGAGHRTPPTRESLDYHVARVTKTLDKHFAFAFFDDANNFGYRILSFAEQGRPITPINTPEAMFNALLRSIPGGCGGAAVTPAYDPRLTVVEALRPAVRDAVRLERLGATERQKIEELETSLQALEKQIGGPQGSLEGSRQCTDLARVKDQLAATGLRRNNNEDADRVLAVMFDILALGMALDRVRTATFSLGSAHAGYAPAHVVVDGKKIDRPYHDLTHFNFRHVADEPTARKITAVDRWILSRVAQLAKTLDGYKEGAQSVLDSSALLLMSETCGFNAKGDLSATHDSKPMPCVLMGGLQGALPPGEFRKLPTTSHNRLLLTLGRGMGLQSLARWGDVDGDEPLF